MARATRVSGSVQIHTVGIRSTQRALRSVDRRAPTELRRSIREAIEPIRLKAAAKLPRGPGRRGKGDDALPHIADTLRVVNVRSGAGIRSRHPGFPVVNFGGTIRPKGEPIDFPADREALYSSIADELGDVQRDIRRRIEVLGERYGL